LKNQPVGSYLAAADAVIGAAILTVLGALAGYFIDSHIHTTPLFSLILLIAGMALGLYRMVIKARSD
jgi:F0F1-type ATP synthase assembly protein I